MKQNAVLMKYIVTRQMLSDLSVNDLKYEALHRATDLAKDEALKFFTPEKLEQSFQDYVLNIQIMQALNRTYQVRWDTMINIEYQGNESASKLEVLKAMKDTLEQLIDDYENDDEKHQGIKITENT